jgi:hypothetical protein
VSFAETTGFRGIGASQSGNYRIGQAGLNRTAGRRLTYQPCLADAEHRSPRQMLYPQERVQPVGDGHGPKPANPRGASPIASRTSATAHNQSEGRSGPDAAGAVLGHSKLETTKVYADRATELAAQVALKTG